MKIRITKIFFMITIFIYICIIIENDSSNSLNLSNLKDCKSAEYIDLYLFKNISISEFPELSNLKGLCIHNVDIEEADISNLQNYKFLSSELYKILILYN